MLVAPAFSHQQPSRRYRDDAPPAIQLPRTLARPVFTEVSREALLAAAPDLAAVPAEFIRHSLLAKAPQMQAGIAALLPLLPKSIPKSDLPSILTVPLRAHPSYPTHVLAITAASSSKSRSEPVSLFPVHPVVLAAHCAKLPRLPPAQPDSRSCATLPVLSFSLPSLQAFTILREYMYTHRLDSALAALLPLPPAFLQTLGPSGLSDAIAAALSSRNAMHALAAHLAASSGSSVSALLAHAAHVKELWHDMVALGLYDDELWDALDLAWAVVLGAFNLVAAQ
ncbi:hypothetical protein FB45DRAFT_941457 [Roridomyces roridus]|uniref:Clp1-like protein n=1 Tax=Roridomyces roridus TaxID=1738132 RepID=A0AAD7B5I7_9AGAR|nr:hypothetical protein FB45DRAFT_941457 [Roridomyces roridus]